MGLQRGQNCGHWSHFNVVKFKQSLGFGVSRKRFRMVFVPHSATAIFSCKLNSPFFLSPSSYKLSAGLPFSTCPGATVLK
jgi:hypothetical protein